MSEAIERRRIAIVTGGSRGIGRAIAVTLAKEGCDVAFSYRQDDAAAAETLALIAATGRRVWAYKGDLNDGACADALVSGTVERFGHLDILVNNAGTTQTKLFLETTDDDFDFIMGTNAKSAFMMSRRAALVMRRQKWGRIVHIGSIGGNRLVGGIAVHYAASKAALSGMTLAMSKELARYNILVNTLAPGLIETDLAQGFMTEKMTADFNAFHPLRRMGTAQETADFVAFLVSDKASYLTGETIVMSGGLA